MRLATAFFARDGRNVRIVGFQRRKRLNRSPISRRIVQEAVHGFNKPKAVRESQPVSLDIKIALSDFGMQRCVCSLPRLRCASETITELLGNL